MGGRFNFEDFHEEQSSDAILNTFHDIYLSSSPSNLFSNLTRHRFFVTNDNSIEQHIKNTVEFLFLGLDENNIKEKFLFNKIKIASEIRVSNTNLYKNTASKIGSRGRTCMLAPAAAIERIIKHTKNRENTLFMFPDFIADNSQGALKRIGLLGVKSEIYGASALLKGMEQADVSIVYAKGFSMDKKFLCYPGSGLLATLGAKTGTPLYVFVNSFNITTKEKANQMHFASISQKSHRQYSNINIVNQKYDLLSSVQISGVISDQGIFSPPIFVKAAKDKNMRLIKALS